MHKKMFSDVIRPPGSSLVLEVACTSTGSTILVLAYGLQLQNLLAFYRRVRRNLTYKPFLPPIKKKVHHRDDRQHHYDRAAM
jgi:hypothetical protein